MKNLLTLIFLVSLTQTVSAVAIHGGAGSAIPEAAHTVPSAEQYEDPGDRLMQQQPERWRRRHRDPRPAFSPASGATLTAGQTVTITDKDEDAIIYYTTDGSRPGRESTQYTAPVKLSTPGTVTFKAISIDRARTSRVATADYTVAAATPPPTFTPASGATLNVGQTVTLADTDTKAAIYYTTDGSKPSAASTPYIAPIALSNAGAVTIHAIAIDGARASRVVRATYTVAAITPPPAFTPASGATLTAGQTVTITDTDAAAAIYYTTDGSKPGAASTRYTAPIALSTAGSVTIKAIAVNGASVSTVASATYTVKASGPSLSGKAQSGTSPLKDAQVQLYAASQSGYGAAAIAIGSAVTTDAAGEFTLPLSCPASPGDLVYLVVTGGDAGGGVNASTQLMAALGPCAKLSASSAVVVNEVTTVASAYALSAFMTAAPNVGSPSSNYQGLTHAFAAVNNLVDITAGKALSVTPAYAANPVPYLNSSTAPQSRVDTLGNIVNSCVDTNGGGAGCSSLFAAATPAAGAAPENTLQAILNIAQNPGTNVATLYGLGSSATGPFQPALSAAPNDWTLALTFTGAGLGMPPGPNGEYGSVPPYGGSSQNYGVADQALAIDATGNIWVAAYIDNTISIPSTIDSVAGMLAEFNPLGAPITPATTIAYNSVGEGTVTFGGFNPSPGNNAPLLNLAIDQGGSLWAAAGYGEPTLYDIDPHLTSPAKTYINIYPWDSVAIDASGHIWVSGSGVSEFRSDGTLIIDNADVSGDSAAPTGYYLPSITFDSNSGLWASAIIKNGEELTTVVQLSTTDGSLLYDSDPITGRVFAADGSGNIYGCGKPSGQTQAELYVFNSGKLTNTYPLPSKRACGDQVVRDGQGHLFSVSSNAGSALPASGVIDEYTSTGVALSPASGYTGTGSGEAATLNWDPNFGVAVQGVSAAVDGSGNLWVLNLDTNGSTTPGNVLVEFVGIAAPVVTPTSVALQKGQLGVRP